MGQVKTNLRRFQCLFEHCCLSTMASIHARGPALMFEKDTSGAYTNLETEELFALWIAGHSQGVADQAYAGGDVQL